MVSLYYTFPTAKHTKKVYVIDGPAWIQLPGAAYNSGIGRHSSTQVCCRAEHQRSSHQKVHVHPEPGTLVSDVVLYRKIPTAR